MFHAYKNGNYSVIIFDDGTKIRRTKEDEFIPSFAENCDVKITDKCSQGCSFCYEGCSVSGKHANLFDYAFLNTLHPYTEMALNGNDLDHPKLRDFLEFLKTKKVFANLTVNQNQFMKNIDKLRDWTDSKLIYGLGVSLVNPGENFLKEVKRFPNAVIHTIAGILTSEDILRLQKKDLKVLILGYKDLSRGSEFLKRNRDEIQSRLNYLRKILPCAISDGWFKVISFDNLDKYCQKPYIEYI